MLPTAMVTDGAKFAEMPDLLKSAIADTINCRYSSRTNN